MKKIFSFIHTHNCSNEEWLISLIEKKVSALEIPGSLFDDNFDDFKRRLNTTGKQVRSVYNALPANVSRNWAETDDYIRREVSIHLHSVISRAAEAGIPMLHFDLGIDHIRKGDEVNGIAMRTSLIHSVLEEAAEANITLCIPLRFPSPYPGSRHWRLTSMLINQVMHKNFRAVLDLFPAEVNTAALTNLMRKSFYTIAAVRFRYDPSLGLNIRKECEMFWDDYLNNSGCEAQIIYAPEINGHELLESELSQI